MNGILIMMTYAQTVRTFSICSIIAALSGAATVQAQQYKIVDLGTLGGTTSIANGISESGNVAGWATLASGVKHAVIWDQSGIVDLGAPIGFIVSEAVAVNDASQIAGFGDLGGAGYEANVWEGGNWMPIGMLQGSTDTIPRDIDSAGRIVGESFVLGPGGPDHAFMWDAGVLTDLGTLGGVSEAHGINEIGQVVGTSLANLLGGTRAIRGFLWDSGQMVGLHPLAGDAASEAFDVNDSGDIVGSSWYYTTQFFSAKSATLWRAGSREATELGVVPAPVGSCSQNPYWHKSIAKAINNSGQIVGGAMCVASGASKAGFLWEDGVMHNLNDLIPSGSGWNITNARDINDAGQIVGTGVAPNGQLHGYMLIEESSSCYADCDPSTGAGVLDVFDFLCFQDAFVGADPYACDCDTSTGQGVCDVFDFLCFQDSFVAGCP